MFLHFIWSHKKKYTSYNYFKKYIGFNIVFPIFVLFCVCDQKMCPNYCATTRITL